MALAFSLLILLVKIETFIVQIVQVLDIICNIINNGNLCAKSAIVVCNIFQCTCSINVYVKNIVCIKYAGQLLTESDKKI